MDLSQPHLIDLLQDCTDADLDRLPFGVIKLDPNGHVVAYNRYESEAAGLGRDRVLGRHFFTEVGGCMDNSLVAGQFASHAEIDLELDHVFALRLQPEPVLLRLLKSARSTAMFLLVKRSDHARP